MREEKGSGGFVDGFCGKFYRDSEIKVDSLGERHAGSKIDGAGGSPHVLLPTIRAGLPSSSGLFLATECATDLSAGWSDVDIDYSAVRTVWAHPLESVRDVLGEETAAETLRHAVVDRDGFLKG